MKTFHGKKHKQRIKIAVRPAYSKKNVWQKLKTMRRIIISGVISRYLPQNMEGLSGNSSKTTDPSIHIRGYEVDYDTV